MHDVGHVIEQFSYPAVVLLCWACGLGAPLSEDLILLFGGALVARGASFPLMVVSAFVGQLGGDLMLFSIGRRWGPAAFRLPGLRNWFTPERLARLEAKFARQGGWLIAAARFLPGMRTPTYLVSGLSQYPRSRFLAVDGLAACVSAPAMVWLGFRFGPPLFQLIQPAAKGIGLALISGGLAYLLAKRLWALRRPRPVASPAVS